MFRAASRSDLLKSRQQGLQYLLDDATGFRGQKAKGGGFQFRDERGRQIKDSVRLARLVALRIPPAWTETWISPLPNGHLQATGRDARGRKQYLYHQDWTTQQSVQKYDRILGFAAQLPRIRRRVARDLATPGLSKDKVLAAVLRLMESTLIRVGNDRYARDNHSFGLTTQQDRHATFQGPTVKFRFRAKSGKWWVCKLNDRRLAAIVRSCKALPGQQLLQYRDSGGQVRDISSTDVNTYLRTITGKAFTAKDFRTWSATSGAIGRLCEDCLGVSQRSIKQRLADVLDCVAQRLNNTRSVCRKSYIHPGVIASFLDRSLEGQAIQAHAHIERQPRGLSRDERFALAVLTELAETR